MLLHRLLRHDDIRPLAKLMYMTPDDYYVDVLDAAEAWLDLVEQDAEPTVGEWDAAHERLGDAVEALRELEHSAHESLREASWGGRRLETIEVIDAADAWYSISTQDEEPPQAEQDASLDRLGAAVQALRHAEP